MRVSGARVAESFDMIAKTFFGLEGVLADELAQLGALDMQPGRRMVAFRGDARFMMRTNLHCRTAVRILKPIATFTAQDDRALYDGIGRIDWLSHLDADGSLAIDPVVHGGDFTNSLYAAQRAKDAIVDQIRDRTGRRPAVDLKDPQLRINLHIDRQHVTVYFDASGDSLHKRGYRGATGDAPINEVRAAGILRLTGWDERVPLADFMCGSGTFLIEGALMARRIAPGLVRQQFGYMRWKDFNSSLHETVIDEARRQILPNLPFRILGSDLDAQVIASARENAQRAGVADDIDWLVESFDATPCRRPLRVTLVTNPPYDERMRIARIEAVYRRIGEALKRHWPGYTAFVLTGNAEAASHIGLRTSAKIRLFNGPIECRLLKFALVAPDAIEVPRQAPGPSAGDSLEAFGNRLSRMARHWRRWSRRQGIDCYRIYDRDLPDIPLAIDSYEGHVVITPYDRRHGRTEIEQSQWLERVVEVVGRTLAVPPRRITLIGRKQDEHAGPRDHDPGRGAVEVRESALRFEVRLGGSKQTGLELDGRVLRSMLRAESDGQRFLSLFGHTGSYALAAAAGGARSTTTVLASRGLVDWAARNLALNGFSGPDHRALCQDPLEFVRELNPDGAPRFDLVIVQPPSFDGQRRPGVWNVQDGHVELANHLLECMAPGGKIYFVSTFRRLTFHVDQIRGASVQEITRQTVPPDFRNKKIHRCWRLIRREHDTHS